MINPFEKLFSKNKVINIKKKKRKARYKLKFDNNEKFVFEIHKVFNMGENKTLICGKVLQGSFSVGDNIKVYGHKCNLPKLEGVIERITTSLVEVNHINCGAKTDMLLKAFYNKENEIFPGNKACKI